MAGYKVSYKVLRQQGEDIKATAKLIDGYAERVGQIRGKLGSDELLAEVRVNLKKLQTQLGESRTVLNVAGEFLMKTVESYSAAETRQVKKVDSTKAHNRDFYKNPVVVASAGGAAAPAPAASAPPANVTMGSSDPVAAAAIPHGQPVSAPQPAGAQTSPFSTAAGAVSQAASASPDAQTSGLGTAGIVAGSALGGAAAAGAVAGGVHLKRKRDAAKQGAAKAFHDADYDPEAELEKAMARVRELEEEDS